MLPVSPLRGQMERVTQSRGRKLRSLTTPRDARASGMRARHREADRSRTGEGDGREPAAQRPGSCLETGVRGRAPIAADALHPIWRGCFFFHAGCFKMLEFPPIKQSKSSAEKTVHGQRARHACTLLCLLVAKVLHACALISFPFFHHSWHHFPHKQFWGLKPTGLSREGGIDPETAGRCRCRCRTRSRALASQRKPLSCMSLNWSRRRSCALTEIGIGLVERAQCD